MITINGVGVKFSKPAPCPSTKIHVKMPIVDPSVNALITDALSGSTTDPNARNINSVVVVSMITSISGPCADRAWMLSCSSAGVPPTSRRSPLGAGIARRSLIFWAASLRLIKPFSITRTDLSFDAPGSSGRSFHMSAGLLSGSTKPLIAIALLRTSATCWSVTSLWLSDSITSVSFSVRKPGKILSNCSWATRAELSGGRYFSLMPPNDSFPNGMISRIIAITIGMANANGRFITTLTSLPQNSPSTSSRVLVFWVFSANQPMMRLDSPQFRRNGTRYRVRTPSESTWRPSTPRMAGSSVIDSNAANPTAAKMA
ncbi:hypothetical protein C1Y40_03728 [Mycobacterium talmoniae]|uniref:Uncharacterized protein n=1 Tax=Mycobacterium talmoniae TaxID=1858794 RepID=A0A2S8BHG6_9MYCO|nr:hypothetical protein C1Y40_03728 [Mycobacterium talmoniae]